MILILLVIAVAGAAPLGLRRLRHKRALLQSAQQFRESLHCMTHALRVGTGLQKAIAYAAQEGQPPLNREWRRVLQKLQVGEPWPEALKELPAQVPLKEAGWFVGAVLITQSTGGSLADVLETLAATLDEKQALREKVAALTAQGKASGVILSALPFLLLGAMAVVSPKMARAMMFTAAGQGLIACMIVLVSLGGLVMYRIVAAEGDA